ncbi:MAG: 23S rRNA (uracil(1939)-C(5))-methyltransferase RlmD [Chitinophagales bacterium]|nr:23S rRNA (uracil(1939)-C(5))-methyltransferase RlmD [Chitinophagales bacterium]
MPKRPTKFIPSVKIDSIASNGSGIGKVEGKVIFVARSIPGDVVDVRVTKERTSFDEGKVAKRIVSSPLRSEAFCEHFGTCGGCKWQDIQYEDQLKFKRQIVKDAFRHIAMVEIPEIGNVLPAPAIKRYRNKLEYTFSNKRFLPIEEIKTGKEIENFDGLGFHIPGRYDKILHLKECHLQEEPSNAIRNFVYDYARSNHLIFFDLKKKTGFLRNLIIRNSTSGEVLVLFSFSTNDQQVIIPMLEAVRKKFPQITCMQYVINSKRNDTIFDLEIKHFSGREYINELIGGYKFRIGAKSFFQTNTVQAEKLYELALEYAAPKQDDTLWDLYCGVGSISIFMAKYCKEVIGIEQIEEAVKDASVNAADNNIKNTTFITGDVRKKLLEPGEIANPDIIITDPPRAGMHPDVVRALMDSNAGKIVYISCNPSTQARDMKELSKKYKIEKMQAIDMFPHTTHIENVVLLVKI